MSRLVLSLLLLTQACTVSEGDDAIETDGTDAADTAPEQPAAADWRVMEGSWEASRVFWTATNDGSPLPIDNAGLKQRVVLTVGPGRDGVGLWQIDAESEGDGDWVNHSCHWAGDADEDEEGRLHMPLHQSHQHADTTELCDPVVVQCEPVAPGEELKCEVWPYAGGAAGEAEHRVYRFDFLSDREPTSELSRIP